MKTLLLALLITTAAHAQVTPNDLVRGYLATQPTRPTLALDPGASQTTNIDGEVFFRQKAATIPQQIEQRCGIHQVGAFNIDDFLKRAAQTKWNFVPLFAMDSTGKGRTWAVYDGKRVIVSVPELQNVAHDKLRQEAFPHMALHETLRDAHVADENYETTMALEQVAQTCNVSEVQDVMQKAMVPKAGLFGRGGVTSTGGGGSDIALIAKLILLTALRQGPKGYTVADVLHAQFETYLDDAHPSEFKVRANADGTKTFLLPMLMFEVSVETDKVEYIAFARFFMENK